MQTESPVTQRGSFIVDDLSHRAVEDAGVDDILAEQGISVTAAAGTITVAGINGNTPWSVYTTDGRKVNTAFGSTSVSVAPGLYLVKVNGAAVKVSVY